MFTVLVSGAAWAEMDPFPHSFSVGRAVDIALVVMPQANLPCELFCCPFSTVVKKARSGMDFCVCSVHWHTRSVKCRKVLFCTVIKCYFLNRELPALCFLRAVILTPMLVWTNTVFSFAMKLILTRSVTTSKTKGKNAVFGVWVLVFCFFVHPLLLTLLEYWISDMLSLSA